MKSFIIGLQDNKGDENRPNRQIAMKVGDKWEYIGVGWTKKKSDGTPFISAVLNNISEYKNKDGQIIPVKGWVIIEEKTHNELLKIYNEWRNAQRTPEEKLSYGEADPNDIPF